MLSINLRKIGIIYLFLLVFFLMPLSVNAEEENTEENVGGAMAATGQVKGLGYATKLYNSSNGLPTSDANCILSWQFLQVNPFQRV